MSVLRTKNETKTSRLTIVLPCSDGLRVSKLITFKLNIVVPQQTASVTLVPHSELLAGGVQTVIGHSRQSLTGVEGPPLRVQTASAILAEF
jgi:hemolysin activation/secretion protein